MSRIGIFAYGVLSYVVFFAVFLYGIGFIGGFSDADELGQRPGIGPRSRTDGGLEPAGRICHSAQRHWARPGFKAWWKKRIVPEAAERSTYVLLSSLALARRLYVLWEPIGGVVWSVPRRYRPQLGSRAVSLRMAPSPIHNLPYRSL